MSASRMATRAPSFCSASARLTAVVDLPTPPLPEATTRMLRMPCTAASCWARGMLATSMSHCQSTMAAPVAALIWASKASFICSNRVWPAKGSTSLMVRVCPCCSMARTKPAATRSWPHPAGLNSARICFTESITINSPLCCRYPEVKGYRTQISGLPTFS